MLYGQQQQPPPSALLEAMQKDPEFLAKLKAEQEGQGMPEMKFPDGSPGPYDINNLASTPGAMPPQGAAPPQGAMPPQGGAPQAVETAQGGVSPLMEAMQNTPEFKNKVSSESGEIPGVTPNFGGEVERPSGAIPTGAIETTKIADQKKKLGFIGRIKQQPGGTMALLQLGAHLMSSQNFFDGLGKGMVAYQSTLDSEKEKLKPQVEYLANGAFKSTLDPATGKRTIERTPIAEFEEAQQKLKLETNLAGIGMRVDGQNVNNIRDNETDLKQTEINTASAEFLGKMSDDTDRWKVDRQGVLDAEQAALEGSIRIKENMAKIKSGTLPPSSVMNTHVELRKSIGAIDGTLKRLSPVIANLENGKLDLGAITNLKQKMALATGVGVNSQTAAYAEMQLVVESMRNALLVLNNGVQTDGDADRALNEIVQGRGDAATVAANFRKAQSEIQRRRASTDKIAQDLESQYGIKNSSRYQTPTSKSPTSGTTKSGVKWKVVG
jgi:hypothetical protein